jgi:hypothetical protein
MGHKFTILNATFYVIEVFRDTFYSPLIAYNNNIVSELLWVKVKMINTAVGV